MSMAPSQLGAFTRSDASRAHANLEYHVQPLSLDSFGSDLHDFPAITVSVCNLNPSSRGHVRIQSGNYKDAPKIAPNYLHTEEDRKVAADSLRQARHIMSQPAMARYTPEEWRPGPQYQAMKSWRNWPVDIANTIFHPTGTVRMGIARMRRRFWIRSCA